MISSYIYIFTYRINIYIYINVISKEIPIQRSLNCIYVRMEPVYRSALQMLMTVFDNGAGAITTRPLSSTSQRRTLGGLRCENFRSAASKDQIHVCSWGG